MKKNKTEIAPFYVINWEHNSDTVEHYNIMPYFVEEWESEKELRAKSAKMHKDRIKETEHYDYEPEKMPKTFDEFKKFIADKGRYQFWARCQYEVILHGWPVKRKSYKLDVYEQIEMNIDTITKIFMDYILNNN